MDFNIPAEIAAYLVELDEFIATLAHELRNPLAPISHSLHLLRRSGADEAAAADLIGQRWVQELERPSFAEVHVDGEEHDTAAPLTQHPLHPELAIDDGAAKVEERREVPHARPIGRCPGGFPVGAKNPDGPEHRRAA